MLSRIRRRLAGDGGMTLIELMIAIVILTVGLMALLGSFIASAHSLQDQQARSAATRVATEALEGYRASGFDALAPGSYEEQVTVNGRTYGLETEIDWMDAQDGQAGGSEDVKSVVVTVTWQIRGAARSSTFETAVASLDYDEAAQAEDPDPAITSVGAVPDPVLVDSEGHPVQDIELSADLVGFDDGAQITAEWEVGDSGATDSALLEALLGDDKWRRTVSSSRFVMPEDGQVRITFTTVPENLARTYDLTLVDDEDELPQITSAGVSPSPINVYSEHPQQGCRDKAQHLEDSCYNTQPVDFSATVANLDPDEVDSVKVRYKLRDGSDGELALTQSGVSGEWTGTLPADSVRFKPGTGQAFTFIATRVTAGLSISTVVNVTVNEV